MKKSNAAIEKENQNLSKTAADFRDIEKKKENNSCLSSGGKEGDLDKLSVTVILTILNNIIPIGV